jgi:hypothetical protein
LDLIRNKGIREKHPRPKTRTGMAIGESPLNFGRKEQAQEPFENSLKRSPLGALEDP